MPPGLETALEGNSVRDRMNDWQVAAEAYFKRIHPDTLRDQSGVDSHFTRVLYAHLDRMWPQVRRKPIHPHKPIAP